MHSYTQRTLTRVLLVTLVSVSGMAIAQNAPLEGISESTDPAKVRDVERRAQDIASRQSSSNAGATSGASDSATDSGARKSEKKRARHSRHGKGDRSHGSTPRH